MIIAVQIARTMVKQPALIGVLSHMSLNARLESLQQRHSSLEARISDEDRRPRPDPDALSRLKVEKLHLKEEIERLRAASG